MKKKQEFDDYEKLNSNLDNEYEDYIDDLIILDDDTFENSNDYNDDTSDGVFYDSNNEDEDEDDEMDDVDIMVKFNTNNHKVEGKHSLSRDTIFKGKNDDTSEQNEYIIHQSDDFNISDGLPIEVGSSYEFESKYYEDYIDRLNLSRDVYQLLQDKTELDFSSNRRKPNKQAFNDYYKMLLDNVGKEYTKSEIFVELSYYFTDNIFNMFKLLDKQYATQIIIELKQRGYLNSLNNINFI